MKIFLDSANIQMIKLFAPFIDGITTNPSLVAAEKYDLEYSQVVKNISSMIDGPISVEVISNTAQEMVDEAKQLASISPNIVIKIPMGIEGLHAVKELANLGIKTNVTLIFSANQALLAIKSGATYVSVFVGRLDDLGYNGMDVVSDTVNIIEKYGYKTEVIAASIRHPMHVLDAARVGSHIATIPPNILEKMSKNPLTEIGIEKFMNDWNKQNYRM